MLVAQAGRRREKEKRAKSRITLPFSVFLKPNNNRNAREVKPVVPIEITSFKSSRLQKIQSIPKSVRGGRSDFLRVGGIVLRTLAVLAMVALLGTGALFLYVYRGYSQIVDQQIASGYLRSRAGIYAAPRVLRPGAAMSPERLVETLRRAGYAENNQSNVYNGGFAVKDGRVEIHPRRGPGAPDTVRVGFDKSARINSLAADDTHIGSFALEPELLTSDNTMKTGAGALLSFKDIPPVLVRSIVAIEDRRFFEHHGIDLSGILRAVLRNTGDGAVRQGGSTITQQLVKNTYLTPERSLRRKFNEAVLARVLERRLSKEEIFALYCNEIYLGQRGATAVRGVNQAARVYFGKNLSDLTLAEAAAIAGMIQSPNRHAPDRHPDSSRERRNAVINAMLRDGSITAEEAQQATSAPLAVVPVETVTAAAAPYFLDYVNRSIGAELDVANSDAPDLRVYTTLELDLQHLAEKVLAEGLAKLDKVYLKKGVTPQAALVAIDPHTGHVLAMVGGRDYSTSQLNRATDARRQPGSVFKPIVYAAALESGASPLSVYADSPRAFTYDGRRQYKPANYGGGYSMHEVTMRTALTRSLNVVTVDIALRAGLTRVAALAEKFGLPRPAPYPALALGTAEATPLEVAGAYTAFANRGDVVNPVVITQAVDSGGNVIVNQATPESRRVIRSDTAFMVTDMLANVIERGTARAARGQIKRTALAGKTGTSRDGWFVGYSPNLVCAVWVGFDDNKELGLTGAEAALPAWVDFMRGAVDLKPELGGETFARPAGITTVEIDAETGLLASYDCPVRERVALAANYAPQYPCFTHQPPVELVAESTEFVDPVQAVQSAVAESAANDVAPTAPALPPAPAVPSVPAIKAARIETNANGRRVLLNDMRAVGTTQ